MAKRNQGINTPRLGVTRSLGVFPVQPQYPAEPRQLDVAEQVRGLLHGLGNIAETLGENRQRQEYADEKERRALQAAEWIDIVPDRLNLDVTKIERSSGESVSDAARRYLTDNMPRYATMDPKNQMRLLDEFGGEYQRSVQRDAEKQFKDEMYGSLHKAVQGISTPHLRDSILSESKVIYDHVHATLGETAANRLYLDSLDFYAATGDPAGIEAIRPYAEAVGLGKDVAQAANAAEGNRLAAVRRYEQAQERQQQDYINDIMDKAVTYDSDNQDADEFARHNHFAALIAEVSQSNIPGEQKGIILAKINSARNQEGMVNEDAIESLNRRIAEFHEYGGDAASLTLAVNAAFSDLSFGLGEPAKKTRARLLDNIQSGDFKQYRKAISPVSSYLETRLTGGMSLGRGPAVTAKLLELDDYMYDWRLKHPDAEPREITKAAYDAAAVILSG
ncbi:MAG TPA: hypothetical protein VMY37_19725, partial [Thermoguttaceae bacterium]|nr:hypothetical protein [Thermoguttaceae bacterium]